MEKVLKGKVQIYGGHFVIKVTNDMYKTMFENTPHFKKLFYNEKQFIEDVKNNYIRAMFFLYEDEKRISKKRIYYLFFAKDATVADIVHECVHWKNSIFDYHGVTNTTNVGDDEHEAYFLDHLVNYVFKNIYPKSTKLYKK